MKTTPIYKLILFLLCTLFFADSLVMAEPLSESEIHDLFTKGKEYFKDANQIASSNSKDARDLYQQSALSFERISKEGGIRNGKLYYNIANAYFLRGDIGRAILNYRRAARYMPSDQNVKQNLAYARSKRMDQIEQTEEAKVLKTLFFWHYDLSAEIRTLIFLICFCLFFVFASIRLFSRKGFLNWGLVVAAILSLLFFGSLLVNSLLDNQHESGVILSADLIARKGNAETYQPSFREPLHAGTEFVLIESRDQWLHVELDDGRTCWLPTTDVELVSP